MFDANIDQDAQYVLSYYVLFIVWIIFHFDAIILCILFLLSVMSNQQLIPGEEGNDKPFISRGLYG